MDDSTSSIPAIHDWHLEKALAELGLLPALTAGQVRCTSCEAVLSLDTVGGILVQGEGRYALMCGRVECLERLSEKPGQ